MTHKEIIEYLRQQYDEKPKEEKEKQTYEQWLEMLLANRYMSMIDEDGV